MWLTRKLATLAHNTGSNDKTTSVTTVISSHAVDDIVFRHPSTLGIIDPTTKPLPPIVTKPSCQQQKPQALTILVSGARGIGKSTLIRLLGWKNVTTIETSYDNTCQRHRAEIQFEDETIRPIDVVEVDGSIMDTIHDPPKFPKELIGSMIHCGLICYDTTRRDSMECLPDLLNTHIARNIPSFLIGLKTDLNCNSLRQVDTALGEELGHLFGLQVFRVDALSDNAPSRIKDIYDALSQQLLLHIQPDTFPTTGNVPTPTDPAVSNLTTITPHQPCSTASSFHMPPSFSTTQAIMRKPAAQPPPSPPHKDNRASFYSTASSSSGYCSSDPYEKALPIKPPTAGFIYAPTATQTRTTTTTLSQTPPTTNSLPITYDGIPPPAPDDMLELYMRSKCARRRGSKDSCESGSGGLTVNDIIDRLLEASDDHIVTIFITFFRKFMKPSELVSALIDRFENDSSSATPPTRVQERIQDILAEWMDMYWNDFHSATARGAVVQFLDRISEEESLRPICDKLAPLAVREPPFDDPDADWGLSDDKEPLNTTDNHDDTISSSTDENDAASPAPAKNKKDSGYVSGSVAVTDLLHNDPDLAIQAPLPSQPSFSSTKIASHQQQQRRTKEPTENGGRTSDESTNSASKRNSAPAASFVATSSDNSKRQKQTTIDLKRATSFHLFHRRSRKSSMSSINMLFSSLSRPSSSASTKIAHNGSAATISATSSEHQQQDKNANTSDHAPGHQYRAEFSGGLNIHLLDRPPSPANGNEASMSASPSCASSLTTVSHSSLFNLSSYYQLASTREPYTQYGKTIAEVPALNLAEQLTWVEAELFRKIKPRDFVRNVHPHAASASIAASISHFNFISAWVATLIVTQGKLAKRAALLEKFMSIAVELRNQNNYNSLMAILAGLNSASVLRLKQTREAISEKKIFKQFQSLERLMSSDRSFSSYRLALKASEAPGIPGIHNQDLLSLAEANRDFRTDGTIHWEKFRLMGESIMVMMKFKTPTYTIQPNGALLQFIAECEILSEDEQYRRSNLVEPRLKSSPSTNKLRDLWMRA
ncbi:ras guanine nucleotide exchange factor domain-containing protein [Syncephalastrum racemosum]|uniref:Ras guanine nucleotide exchange factor domain-containing protein n=1 Tax=Syncephalastrum racemosum TaxID=13706 RepID=A0A1X2H4U1_SYNRA|nr:ras guanine nucleotide exchange factor domain-containing protein [Syncephalastrum racemosum]